MSGKPQVPAALVSCLRTRSRRRRRRSDAAAAAAMGASSSLPATRGARAADATGANPLTSPHALEALVERLRAPSAADRRWAATAARRHVHDATVAVTARGATAPFVRAVLSSAPSRRDAAPLHCVPRLARALVAAAAASQTRSDAAAADAVLAALAALSSLAELLRAVEAVKTVETPATAHNVVHDVDPPPQSRKARRRRPRKQSLRKNTLRKHQHRHQHQHHSERNPDRPSDRHPPPPNSTVLPAVVVRGLIPSAQTAQPTTLPPSEKAPLYMIAGVLRKRAMPLLVARTFDPDMRIADAARVALIAMCRVEAVRPAAWTPTARAALAFRSAPKIHTLRPLLDALSNLMHCVVYQSVVSRSQNEERERTSRGSATVRPTFSNPVRGAGPEVFDLARDASLLAPGPPHSVAPQPAHMADADSADIVDHAVTVPIGDDPIADSIFDRCGGSSGRLGFRNSLRSSTEGHFSGRSPPQARAQGAADEDIHEQVSSQRSRSLLSLMRRSSHASLPPEMGGTRDALGFGRRESGSAAIPRGISSMHTDPYPSSSNLRASSAGAPVPQPKKFLVDMSDAEIVASDVYLRRDMRAAMSCMASLLMCHYVSAEARAIVASEFAVLLVNARSGHRARATGLDRYIYRRTAMAAFTDYAPTLYTVSMDSLFRWSDTGEPVPNSSCHPKTANACMSLIATLTEMCPDRCPMRRALVAGMTNRALLSVSLATVDKSSLIYDELTGRLSAAVEKYDSDTDDSSDTPGSVATQSSDEDDIVDAGIGATLVERPELVESWIDRNSATKVEQGPATVRVTVVRPETARKSRNDDRAEEAREAVQRRKDMSSAISALSTVTRACPSNATLSVSGELMARKCMHALCAIACRAALPNVRALLPAYSDVALLESLRAWNALSMSSLRGLLWARGPLYSSSVVMLATVTRRIALLRTLDLHTVAADGETPAYEGSTSEAFGEAEAAVVGARVGASALKTGLPRTDGRPSLTANRDMIPRASGDADKVHRGADDLDDLDAEDVDDDTIGLEDSVEGGTVYSGRSVPATLSRSSTVAPADGSAPTLVPTADRNPVSKPLASPAPHVTFEHGPSTTQPPGRRLSGIARSPSLRPGDRLSMQVEAARAAELFNALVTVVGMLLGQCDASVLTRDLFRAVLHLYACDERVCGSHERGLSSSIRAARQIQDSGAIHDELLRGHWKVPGSAGGRSFQTGGTTAPAVQSASAATTTALGAAGDLAQGFGHTTPLQSGAAESLPERETTTSPSEYQPLETSFATDRPEAAVEDREDARVSEIVEAMSGASSAEVGLWYCGSTLAAAIAPGPDALKHASVGAGSSLHGEREAQAPSLQTASAEHLLEEFAEAITTVIAGFESCGISRLHVEDTPVPKSVLDVFWGDIMDTNSAVLLSVFDRVMNRYAERSTTRARRFNDATNAAPHDRDGSTTDQLRAEVGALRAEVEAMRKAIESQARAPEHGGAVPWAPRMGYRKLSGGSVGMRKRGGRRRPLSGLT